MKSLLIIITIVIYSISSSYANIIPYISIKNNPKNHFPGNSFVPSNYASPATVAFVHKTTAVHKNILNTTAVNLIKLHVNSTANTYSDEMYVNFINTATANQGVIKWFSMIAEAPSLYSVKNGTFFTINTLSNVTDNLIIPIGFIAGVNGTYTITASELNSFSTTTYIYLKDLKTNFIQFLNQNSSYTFTGSISDDYNRFQLIFALTPCGWLGNTSSDWAVSSNWANTSQPLASDNIVINAWVAKQPHITSTAGAPAICNNLTINSGAILTIDAGKALTVNGTITNNAGSTAIVLKSDANGTASLINNTANVTATAERYIAKDNSWHFLSSPTVNQAIKPNFAPTLVNQTFDFYKWDETVAISALPWINIRDINGAYTAGFDNFETSRGYLVAYSSLYNGTDNHNFIGSLNAGDQIITVTSGGNHYNLIGNPFPSAIDWNNINLLSNASLTLGLNPPIWIWNHNSGNYGVYANGVGTNSVSNIIAPHQGFFVQAISNASFLIPDNARIHSLNQNFMKEASAKLVKLHVSSTMNTYSDEMIINFDSNATSDQGVEKWFSLYAEAPSIYSVKNGKNFSINTLPAVINNLTVAVYFKAGISGIYTITASDLNSFESGTIVYLKDLKTNILKDLSQNPTYTYTSTVNDSVNRFQLIFVISPSNTSVYTVQNTKIYTFANNININSNENVKLICIYNIMGELIKTIENTNNSLQFNLFENTPGYYIVKVITAKNVYSEKIIIR